MRVAGDRAGRAVPVACAVVFPTVGVAGRRGNATVKGGLEVALLRTGGVRAAVLGFGVGAEAKGANCWILASLFDMARLPAFTALRERGRRVDAFDNMVFAIGQSEGGVFHQQIMFSGHLNHH